MSDARWLTDMAAGDVVRIPVSDLRALVDQGEMARERHGQKSPWPAVEDQPTRRATGNGLGQVEALDSVVPK